MKEPDFFINKAIEIIEEIYKLDMFELDENDSKKYHDELLASTDFNLEDKENDVDYASSISNLKRNIDKFSEIKFNTKLLFKEFDNDLFFKNYDEFLNKSNSEFYNIVPKIKMSEYNKSIDILEKFIVFINEYRK